MLKMTYLFGHTVLHTHKHNNNSKIYFIVNYILFPLLEILKYINFLVFL